MDGDAAAAAAGQLGERAFSSVLDVRDPEACRAAAATTAARAGSLEVWVNNAGVLFSGYPWGHDERALRAMIDVNALGTVNGTLAALELMRGTGGGHIVNVVSLAGIVAAPGETVYSASKHAAIAFSIGTLLDLRRAGVKDVRISCLCPDGIWTPMLQEKLFDPEAAASFSGSMLLPEEVAACVPKLLDRPRPVMTFPRRRGVLARLFDAFPRLAYAGMPAIMATGRLKQRILRRKVDRGQWPPPRRS